MSRSLFYRMPRWAVRLECFFSLLSCALILMTVASISSQSQSIFTMPPLMTGSWAMMVMATGINNWARASIPAAAVSKEEGGLA